ncbi:MAG: hypothetical protein Q9220_006077 [cf. Caloplaca sp. 1 TL-2023]
MPTHLTIKETLAELSEPQDFNISTWMTFGAILLLLSQAYLPTYVTTTIPVLLLSFRIMKVVIDTLRLHTGSFTTLMRGRWTARLPHSASAPDGFDGSGGVVLFVLGARINHPLGKLTPGAAEINEVFQAMWREAEGNRVKWGYLGRTATLVDHSDTEQAPTIWLSYWRDLKGLQEFSTTAAHRLGQSNYNANKYPYMGIMHETYYSPKGCWETIYDDFTPWGLGNAKIAVGEDEKGLKLGKTLAPNTKHSTMLRRMGRKSFQEQEASKA